MKEKVSILEAEWQCHSVRLLAVRTVVFVEEQNVPAEIEVDEFDPVSLHVLALDALGAPVGTARLLPADEAGRSKIGRVAVLKPWRKRGVGSLMMNHLIEKAKKRGDREILLHAQTWTLPFYESLGFSAEGEEFSEANIPHRKMRLILR